MTATEKILARASDKCEVKPGENGWINVDVLMINDITCPGVSGIFKREFGNAAKLCILHSSPRNLCFKN
jgi:3-isopropylmalate/(R)-2-methylmalate dehydratase large subunit